MTKEIEYRKDKKKILVLGSNQHSKIVTSYLWQYLPPDLNVADFDVVIINLIPFQNETFAHEFNKNTPFFING